MARPAGRRSAQGCGGGRGGDRADDGTAGFMLIEVIVGMAIVSMAFAYGFPALSESLGRLRRDQDAAEAVSLARSTLARVGQDIALRTGETGGRTDDGFEWQVTAAPYDGVAVSPAAGVAGYSVRVTVSWRDRGRVRDLSLTTVRLAYAPGDP